MKIFVSGKVGSENDAKRLMKTLREAGHEITFDWTEIPHLKPYDENSRASREAAILEARGIKESDLVVIIAHAHGLGMFVEMGIAIGSGIPVRVISDNESRSMFFHHPLVKRVSSPDEIIREFS
jgi:nucleoside 2-deoxyribosyltransferase